jgi:hypothetical protein
MSRPEVEWVLDQVASVVAAQPDDHPLRRVDRDESLVYEGSQSLSMSSPTRDLEGELKQSNLVGATWAGRDRTPIGTGYDYDVENVVGVRVLGLHHSEWGHVDPDGSEGVDFGTLVDDVIDAIDDGATFPTVSNALGDYTHLLVTNESPGLSDWQDFYRYDFDVIFSGYEDRD